MPDIEEKTISNSINYGINMIIERATSEESRWLINHIKNKFKEEIYSLFNEHALEREKAKGNIIPVNWPQNHVKNFWKVISELFDYEFGKLEWIALTNNTPDGALHFIYRLCNKYTEKFYSDPKEAINHPINELYGLVSEIYGKQVRKKIE